MVSLSMDNPDIGQINRLLGTMPPKVLASCIDDAFNRDMHGSKVHLNVGIGVRKENIVEVDVDRLSQAIKVRMVRANVSCAEWFREFDTHVFKFICDNRFPLTSINFAVPDYDLLYELDTRRAPHLMEIEFTKYIAENMPHLIDKVREFAGKRLITGSASDVIYEYIKVMEPIWDRKKDGAVICKVASGAMCVHLIRLYNEFPDFIDEELLSAMVSASLKNHWTNANYKSMSTEYQEKFRRTYKLTMLKQGLPS